MMSLKRIRYFVCSLTLTALLLMAIKALAAVLTNVEIPISGTVFNPCNGENVSFSGADHFTASVTLDRGGGFHLGAHDNIHVTAMGDQGNSYIGNQEDSFQLSGQVGAQLTATFTFSEISRGSAPNFELQALLHITVNPNGTVTASISNFTPACRG